MDPVTPSTTLSHHHPPPVPHHNFRFPFHPILRAPAPHLRPLLKLRPKFEPDLTTAKQDNKSEHVRSAAEDHELTCRPSGHPSGSKNKPKSPIIVTRNIANSLHCHVLEISDGCDVANSVAAFAARHQRSLWIVSGSGIVSDVTVLQPGYSDTVVTLRGRFEILSILGSFLSSPPVPAATSGITVYLASGQGEVVGGSVVGELRAYGKVILMAVSFANTAYERLPFEEAKVETNG